MRQQPLGLAVLCAALAAAAATCPSSEWLPYRGQCYWASPSPLEWRSVASVCDLESPGSLPVSVHDVQVNAFLAEQALNFSSGWLGLRRAKSGEPWRWSDGTEYDWHNWEEGQPKGDDERCAFIHKGVYGAWRTADCTLGYMPFICQVEDQPDTTIAPTTTELTTTFEPTTTSEPSTFETTSEPTTTEQTSTEPTTFETTYEPTTTFEPSTTETTTFETTTFDTTTFETTTSGTTSTWWPWWTTELTTTLEPTTSEPSTFETTSWPWWTTEPTSTPWLPTEPTWTPWTWLKF